MSGGGTLDSVLVSTTRSGCCFPILAGGAWPGQVRGVARASGRGRGLREREEDADRDA